MPLQGRKETLPRPCKPDCENYDPCYGRKTINTEFRVRPGDRGFKPHEEWCDLITTDTFNAVSIRFDIPPENPENSSYEWQIGSEITPRTEKGFEIDFGDYLSSGKWESTIQITLTIRTPMNECLESENETTKVAKRDLYFTRVRHHALGAPLDTAIFVGYMLDNPSKEIEIKAIRYFDEYYKDIRTYGTHSLLFGHPHADTILLPMLPFLKQCGNFKHRKTITISEQNPALFEKVNKYFHGLKVQDYIYLKEKQFLIRFEFENNGKSKEYEFIGSKIR